MFDSCICVEVDDGERAKIHNESLVVAKARRECGECRGWIDPGERYEKVDQLYEFGWTHHATCQTCRRIRETLFSCGWFYGMVWEDIHEAFCGHPDDEDYFCVCPDTLGRKP